MAIEVNGKKRKVLEDLGYVHSRGCFAKIVSINGKDTVVLKKMGKWKIAIPIVVSKEKYEGQQTNP